MGGPESPRKFLPPLQVQKETNTHSETLVCCNESLKFLMAARLSSMSR